MLDQEPSWLRLALSPHIEQAPEDEANCGALSWPAKSEKDPGLRYLFSFFFAPTYYTV